MEILTIDNVPECRLQYKSTHISQTLNCQNITMVSLIYWIHAKTVAHPF